MPAQICFALLLAVLLPAGGTAAPDKLLPVAFCTPEHSQCRLASDGKPDSCFAAGSLLENFYFAVFNTVGRPVSVEKVTLRVGRAARAKYNVSLTSGSVASDLQCGAAEDATIECPAGAHNVTSLMVRPQPLMWRLSLLEVAAFRADGTRVNFTYCVAPEAEDEASCRHAMDGTAAADSRRAVSGPAQFPAWYGGLGQPEPIQSVRIYRPAKAAAESHFRVLAAADCERVADSVDAGVEVLEFRCPAEQHPVNLLQVWEFDAHFLISLCEVEVHGSEA